MRNKNSPAKLVSQLLTAPSCVLLFTLCLVVSAPVLALDILVGSSQSGTFNYRVGRALCQLINTNENALQCDVVPAEPDLHSSDTIHTLTNVLSGGLDLGIVDSSIQYDAANRTGQFEYFDFSFDNLRSLFSMNGIPFTVAVQGNEDLDSLDELKGKRINIGNPGSSQRAIMDNLMRVKGWQKNDFLLVEELPATQSQDTLALCFGSVDAVVRFDAHPNADTKHIVDLCDARLLNIAGDEVRELLESKPYYYELSVPANTYAAISGEVNTFGLLETIVTTDSLDEESAYLLVKAVFENLDWLRPRHPAFSTLSPVDMHSQGLSVPLHSGALKYYRERGWMQ